MHGSSVVVLIRESAGLETPHAPAGLAHGAVQQILRPYACMQLIPGRADTAFQLRTTNIWCCMYSSGLWMPLQSPQKTCEKHYTDLRLQDRVLRELHDRVESALGWVGHLALVWPSNLMASAGEGPAAAKALLLSSLYARHVLDATKVGACWPGSFMVAGQLPQPILCT